MILVIIAVILNCLLLAPLGCILLWQRYYFLSDGIAHACLFSCILSHFFKFSPIISMIFVSILFSIGVYIFKFFSNKNIVVNLISTSMVAISILFAAKINNSSILQNLLFGDILSISLNDLYIFIALIILCSFLIKIYLEDLVFLSLNEDLAKISRVKVKTIELVSLLIFSVIIALTIKFFGVLLIAAILNIPAASARLIASSPLSMILYSILFALLSGIIGIYFSFELDLPLSPSIVIISIFIYCIINFVNYIQRRKI